MQQAAAAAPVSEQRPYPLFAVSSGAELRFALDSFRRSVCDFLCTEGYLVKNALICRVRFRQEQDPTRRLRRESDGRERRLTAECLLLLLQVQEPTRETRWRGNSGGILLGRLDGVVSWLYLRSWSCLTAPGPERRLLVFQMTATSKR